MKQPKLGILIHFGQLGSEKMRKSAKGSQLGIQNKMPECRFGYTTHVLVLGCIPVKITKCVLSAQALCSDRVLCAEAEAKQQHICWGVLILVCQFIKTLLQ